MATTYEAGERIVLTKHDTGILLALLSGNLAAYQIATQYQSDSAGSTRMSNGTLRPALVGLKKLSFIGRNANGTYKITPLGRQVLEWELERMGSQIRLAQYRLKKPSARG